MNSLKCKQFKTIPSMNWDNLNKISKLNLKFSKSNENTETLLGPPKRKKIVMLVLCLF